MKKTNILAAIIIGLTLFIPPALLACQASPAPSPSANPATPTAPSSTIPNTLKKLTLADYADLLDISAVLPASFGQIDASVLGLSHKQLGLGEKWSEVESFLSKNPFQIIYCTYNIVDNSAGRIQADANLKDEAPVKVEIQSGIMEAAAAVGLKQSPVNVKMSSPAIGDLALLGEGLMETQSGNFGCDILNFKSGIVYFNIVSVYNPTRLVETPKVAGAIIEKLKGYSQ